MSRRSHYTELNDSSFLASLNEDMDAVHRKLDRAEKRRQTMTVRIEATNTEIRHKIGRPAKVKAIALHDDARWWQVAAPTDKAVFLRASIAVIADIELEEI